MKLATVSTMALSSMLLFGYGDLSPVKAASPDGLTLDGVLYQVKPILEKYRKAARMDFHADRCGPGGSSLYDLREVPFPKTIISAPNTDDNALVAIQSIFRDDQSVVVSQDDSGLIRIRIGKVADALLNTKIRKISFTPKNQYNIRFAIDHVEDVSNVKVAMVRFNRHPNLLPYIGGVMDPTPGWPHLPPFITNTTYGQLLDVIAQTFGGVVSHGECDNPGRIVTDFKYVFDVVSHGPNGR
jgi:hypothetical protein